MFLKKIVKLDFMKNSWNFRENNFHEKNNPNTYLLGLKQMLSKLSPKQWKLKCILEQNSAKPNHVVVSNLLNVLQFQDGKFFYHPQQSKKEKKCG